ncbi:respiratory nitrate reductase subunit gamma [Thiohalomonas denitrificans]|uniref:nitrate reductase (quinone) n=1 Tax=Thiohalomonas denitrificans TaxID=415747 RepID=A0A1G5QYC6_9GAMM|nr:respiratory nitrate reductase subunit gamma [Thiohalomonas denitrificans]SCZ66874.1 nitrate reductase gamma subunit [Thiohalomonas denitrificans]
MEYLNQLIFGVGPYLAGTVFILGSILRYERGQYTWRAMSSQMLHNTRSYRVGNLLFHIGILSLFLGHLVGLLTPQPLYYAIGMTSGTKQILSMVIGGAFGIICLAGISVILWRRFMVPAVRANSSPMDNFILVLLALQLITGFVTIYVSRHHLGGEVMTELANWAQHIVTFQSGAWRFVLEVPWPYKLHIALGLLMFAAFPFSRLVHIWSWPWAYLRRNYQVVRAR